MEKDTEILATDITGDNIYKADETIEYYLDSDGKVNERVLQEKK